MLEQVQAWLTQWFVRHGKIASAREFPLDLDYFAEGWLSSIEIVEFVTEIENQFALQFSETDLQDPRLVSVSGLSKLILECSARPIRSR